MDEQEMNVAEQEFAPETAQPEDVSVEPVATPVQPEETV